MIFASNFGRSSILRERLVSGNIVTDGPYVNKTLTKDHLITSIIGETEYPNKCIQEIKEALKNITIDEQELTRKKRVALSNFIMSFDSIENVNSNILNDIITFDKIINDVYNIYTDLDINTGKKIAEKLITDNITVIILKKEND